MTGGDIDRQAASFERRFRRAVRRSRKAPAKLIQRFQGYDNSQPIILEGNDAIYFQIPKVASSALKELLMNEMHLSGPAPHATLFPTVSRSQIELGVYDDYFKFGFVRNPWARVASCYQMKILQGRNINGTLRNRFLMRIGPGSLGGLANSLSPHPVLHRRMSFEEFVDAVSATPDEHTDKHLRSQYTFFSGQQGKMLVDYVGRLENFKEDFSYVAKRIGLSVDSLPKQGRSRTRPYREYYNPDTWELVTQRYRRDIDLFGYGDHRLDV